MALKPCLDCGRLSPGSRCPTHTRDRDAATTRGKRERRPYTHGEQERRAQAVRDHVALYGYWCPGYLVEPHPAHDLTGDHPTPVAGGGREDQPLAVLCRRCNSRKGAG